MIVIVVVCKQRWSCFFYFVESDIKLFANILIILMFTAFPTANGEQKATESQVKVAFLERFTRFVTWPDQSQMDKPEFDFELVVFGDNPFGEILQATYAKQKIKNKKVRIKITSKITDCADADLLFISSGMEEQLEEVLKAVEGKPVLTVSDSKGFAQRGVMINLYISSNQPNFEINETVVSKSTLKFSHLLLQKAGRLVK